MERKAVYDASSLPRETHDHRAPLWWGIIGLITIEVTVFASMIGSYFYLRVLSDAWPPAGVAPPALFWPTVNLGLLLLSGFLMWWAGRGLSLGNRRVLVVGIFLAVGLAILVAVFRTLQMMHLAFRWDSHAYGSIVWTLTGLHYGHVLAALLGTAVYGVLGHLGHFTQARQLGVVVDTMYWQFMVLIWVPVYLVLYWAPRWP